MYLYYSLKKILKQILKYTILFFVGGGIYCCLELLLRQYTHVSMYIVGGIAFILIGAINSILSWETPLVIQMIIGRGIITFLEFTTGCIVNLWLSLDVWDYSCLPFNLMGQICLYFSLLWILLSAVGIVLDDFIRYFFFSEEKPHYKFLE